MGKFFLTLAATMAFGTSVFAADTVDAEAKERNQKIQATLDLYCGQIRDGDANVSIGYRRQAHATCEQVWRGQAESDVRAQEKKLQEKKRQK